eukprot:Skav206118  [mRNA]  locus=scaffold172:134983:135844:+ [translate_table: standard]
MGWLPNEMQKGSKQLKPGEEMEEFAALLADELGEDAIDMLREGAGDVVNSVGTSVALRPTLALDEAKFQRFIHWGGTEY